MSDTPRTDAAAIRCACSTYVVPSDFARELERENAALLLKIQDLELQNNAMRSTSRGKEVAKNKKLERENAELQRELTALKINYAQDKENYQCAARAGMAIEEKLKHENETLRKSMKSITPFLAELVNVFDCAQTNGDLFDLADVCIKYRAAIDAARKEAQP